jgi:hypothetical protein
LRPNKANKKGRRRAAGDWLFHAYDCPKQEQVGQAAELDISNPLPCRDPFQQGFLISSGKRHSQVKIGTIWSTPCVFTNRKIDRSITNNHSIDH